MISRFLPYPVYQLYPAFSVEVAIDMQCKMKRANAARHGSSIRDNLIHSVPGENIEWVGVGCLKTRAGGVPTRGFYRRR
jgi:hypothetical protein